MKIESKKKLNEDKSINKKNLNKENIINNDNRVKANIITINSSYCFDKSISQLSNYSLNNNDTQEESRLIEEENSFDNKLNYIQTQRDLIVKKRKYNIIQNSKIQSKQLLRPNSNFISFLNDFSYKKDEINPKLKENENINENKFSESESDSKCSEENENNNKTKNSYLLNFDTPYIKNFSPKESSSEKFLFSSSNLKNHFGSISIEKYKFDPSNFN
jgi:hypothetical protein